MDELKKTINASAESMRRAVDVMKADTETIARLRKQLDDVLFMGHFFQEKYYNIRSGRDRTYFQDPN